MELRNLLEYIIENFVPIIIHTLELMGILILVIGALKAFYHYLRSLFVEDAYHLKYQFANAMAMALEFKLAAEILKTVIVTDMRDIAILAAIIVLRVIMTFVIHWEMKEELNENENKDKFDYKRRKKTPAT